jgi:MoaA/NifB/PqqE/SkfB family radical SAM enzyme
VAATSEAPAWLTQLYETLRRAHLPLTAIVATDDALDLSFDGAADQALVVEVRPRVASERSFATTRRHAIRYRSAGELLPANRELVLIVGRLLAHFEALVPERFRGAASVGDVTIPPEALLRRRFPFAYVERSGSAERTDTELLVRMTPQCNQNCPFCSAPPQLQPSPEAIAACFEFIGGNFPGAHLTLTGGEPTLRGGFFGELEAALAGAGVAGVQVQTNAVTFGSDARVAGLPHDPRLSFFVSLHATDEAVYDACTGTTGQLPRALDGIRKLLGAGQRVVLNTVVCRANLGHLPALMDSLPVLFAGLPLPQLHFSVLLCPDGRPGAADLLVRYAELAPALEAAAARATALGIACEPLVSSTHASIPLCLVSAEQRAASTHRPELAPGETGYEDFTRPWVKAARCRDCAATERCLGLPAPYALRFGFDELRPFGTASEPRASTATGKDAEASAPEKPRRARFLPVPEAIVKKRPAGPPVLCVQPWTTLEIVNPDGLARQCCADWTLGARGELGPQTLEQIWNGPGYQDARRAMCSGDTRSLCASLCPRLHDHASAESTLRILGGSERFVRNQLLMAEDVAERRAVTRAMPLFMSVCPSTYCNANCIMCEHGREPRRDLPEAFWDELPRFLPTLARLTLLGGEPLANPTVWQFLRDVDRERYPDLNLDLITNGSLLTESALALIERAPIGGVTLSLNAGTAEVYERVQRNLAFDTTLANLDALVRFRNASPRWFGITLSAVVQPASAATLVDIAELAHARDLHVRFLPLCVGNITELDFYRDPDEVARLIEHLDRLLAWTERNRPEWRTEVSASRDAILAEHARAMGSG